MELTVPGRDGGAVSLLPGRMLKFQHHEIIAQQDSWPEGQLPRGHQYSRP
jgi:hypothetical protein